MLLGFLGDMLSIFLYLLDPAAIVHAECLEVVRFRSAPKNRTQRACELFAFACYGLQYNLLGLGSFCGWLVCGTDLCEHLL